MDPNYYSHIFVLLFKLNSQILIIQSYQNQTNKLPNKNYTETMIKCFIQYTKILDYL